MNRIVEKESITYNEATLRKQLSYLYHNPGLLSLVHTDQDSLPDRKLSMLVR